MPKIYSPGYNLAAFRTIINSANQPAHHYRLIGLEIAQKESTDAADTLINLGSADSYDSVVQNTFEKVAYDFVIDRCYIHGHPQGQTKRGIGLHSLRSDVTNSYISEIHRAGQDSQAIAGWNGTGFYKIINNYLEAAGENVLFGGADPMITNLIPSDIEIRRNYFFIPAAWRQSQPRWTVSTLR